MNVRVQILDRWHYKSNRREPQLSILDIVKARFAKAQLQNYEVDDTTSQICANLDCQSSIVKVEDFSTHTHLT